MTGRMIAISIALVSLVSVAARADDNAEARKHFEAGQLHYTLGEFAEAATDFKEAYRLRQEPALLFNIAQAMRKSFQWERAYFYFTQYLKNKPDAANRSEVEGLMVQMKQKQEEAAPLVRAAEPEAIATASAAAQVKPVPGKIVAATEPRGAASQAAPKAAVAAVSRPPAPPVGGKGNGAHIAGYVALGLGAGAEALAFAFHSSAQSKADQFNQRYDARTLTPADAQLKSDAQSKGRLATGAAIGGSLLLVTGSVLAFAF